MSSLTADQLATRLSAVIQQLPAGSRLPSEHELMTRFQVPRSLVRAAVGMLEALYQVRRVQGSGTFVNRRIDYRISNTRAPSFHETVRAAGGSSRTIVVGAGPEVLPSAAAEVMRIPPAQRRLPLLRLHRLSHINELPASYLEEWFVDGVMSQPETAVGVYGSVHAALLAGGFQPRRRWCVGSVDTPPRLARQRLDLGDHELTWVVESVVDDARTGRDLFFSRAWTRQDSIRMVWELGE